MFKNILLAISSIILPVILSFLIYIQISQIIKSKDEFNLTVGRIEDLGTTVRFHEGSARSPNSSSDVFFIALENNDTIYSYFTGSTQRYSLLKSKIKIGDTVKVYNEGYNEKQNTVDIVALEKSNQILISKAEFDKKAYMLLVLFSIFLILYFYIPYKWIYLKAKKSNIKTLNKL